MAFARKALASNFTGHLTRRVYPSFSHLIHDDREPAAPPDSPVPFHRHASTLAPPFSAFGRRRSLVGISLPLGLDPSLLRRYSSSSEGSNEIGGLIKDATEVLTDSSVETAAAAAAALVPPAPFPGEVAAAAADSAFLVAGLQHLIDAVHSFTGLNWWSSIALSTFLIRGATVPILLSQLKATVKLGLMRPELEEIKGQIDSSDPHSTMEGQKRMQALFKKHGVTPFTPLRGMLIQGPVFISFYFGISNMVEKVPSFKGGGALWFTDLTTPDPMYLFPLLTALTFLATVELNMQEGMEGNPMARSMKNFSRILAFLTVPFTATFPKAIFCYWVTSNLFSLAYGFVLKRPPVRKYLNLPETVPQSALATQPKFSFFSSPKQITPADSVLTSKEPAASPRTTKVSEQTDLPDRRVSSSAAINHRIRSLEKTVKARKKTKKR